MLALCATCLVSLAGAETITRIDSWPGYERHPLRQVAAAASNAYLTTIDGLQIFDCSNPAQPESMSFLPLYETWEYPTDIHCLTESNRLAIGVGVSYGTYTNCIKGIDISNPQDPLYAWKGPLFHRPNQVSQHGPKVYSSHNLSGLSVSTWGSAGDPSTPAQVTNAMGRVAVKGSRLYVPTTGGFQVFNYSNEAFLGTFSMGYDGRALAVDDGLYVYLITEDGLHVVDAAFPAAMSEIGFLPLASGNYDPTDIHLTGHHACMTFDNTNLFMMVSVTNPASPSIRGTYPFPGPVQYMDVDGEFAYVLAADDLFGPLDLHILDLTDPMDITETNRLYAHGTANQLALGSGVLFLADGQNGLCVLDTGSSAMSMLGQLPGTANSVAADGSQVYAAIFDGIFDTLYAYDASVPDTPVAITNLSLFSPAAHLAVSTDFVCWIGDYGMTLSVADRTPPLTNHRQKYLSDVQALDVVDDLYALVADNVWTSINLLVIDLQDSSLQILTNYAASAPIVDVAGQMDAFRTNAFLALTNGMEVLDLSHSSHFSVTASWAAPAGQIPQCISVDGDRIALASTNHLWILDATQLNDGNPVIVETAIDYAVSQMVLSGDRLYAAARANGVTVYQIGGGTILPSLQLTVESATQIELDWSDAGTGWQVQQNEALTNASGWITLPGTETITVTNLDTSMSNGFFRLIQ